MSRDPRLLRYVEAIEARLGRMHGKDHALSPPEFALARGWFRAGVPLAWVLECLDDVERVGDDTLALSRCREQIQALARTRQR